MYHQDLQPHDILVAASIARQHGFTQTHDALQNMAKCASCRNAVRCNGTICIFDPGQPKEALAQ